MKMGLKLRCLCLYSAINTHSVIYESAEVINLKNNPCTKKHRDCYDLNSNVFIA